MTRPNTDRHPAWRSLALLVGALAVAGLAGCSGAAPATEPAAAGPSAAPVVAAQLFIDADTVLGPANLTEAEKPVKTCVQLSKFARNEEVVWRVKVVDPATGQPMDDKALSGVEVKLPDQSLALRYGPHPKNTPTDFFWTVGWDVPADYPTGTVPYTIEATANDGRSGAYEQFKVSLAQLTITEDVRKVIAN
jgi:hypothetical protein